MHIDLKGKNEEFCLHMSRELDCSVTDYVNSVLAAVRDSEYVREFKIQLVSKTDPAKKVCKTIKYRRSSRTDRYDPLNYKV
jgi:hypothetical protein